MVERVVAVVNDAIIRPARLETRLLLVRGEDADRRPHERERRLSS